MTIVNLCDYNFVLQTNISFPWDIEVAKVLNNPQSCTHYV